MFFDILLVLITITLCFVIFYTWNYDYWRKRRIPYETPIFPFGSIKDGLLLRKPLGSIIHELYSKYKDYKYFGIFLGRHPVLFIRDPEIFKMITVKKFNDFRDNTATTSEKSDVLGALNPFILKGERWKISRKHTAPAFTTIKIKQNMYPNMVYVSERLKMYITKNLDNFCNGIKIQSLAQDFASEIFTLCGLSIKTDALFANSKNPFKRIAHETFETETSTGKLRWILMIVDPALSLLLRTTLMPQTAGKYFRKVIKDVRLQRKLNNINANDYLSYLDKLLIDNGDFSEDDLASNIVTLFIDGVETVASTIKLTMTEIVANPRVFKKLREEIDTIMAKYDNKLTYETLRDMTYLDHCISEALRMHPVLMWFMRNCTADSFQFPPYKDGVNRDVKIDKGFSVLLPVYALHHDENLHANPETFYPERFSDEDTKVQSKANYFGFGDGPRICLGMKYGQLVTKIAIWDMVSNFDIVLNDKCKYPIKNVGASFVFVPEDEPLLNFYKRGEICVLYSHQNK
ncbi:cytochrome P450 6a2-like [Chrysoperla carnea]|uniref:cytochrome P450 6a2-like n=1 Tax=Chrysoperla carnea TaxID=189513 RepID=UPI001D065E6C|nr:cytochrome P450 6a2-like [Chrysoperla carnea]